MKSTIFIRSLFFSDYKRKDSLIPGTQRGANTFSCKVNGEIFVAKACQSEPVYATYDKSTQYMTFTGDNTIDNPYRSIHVEVAAYTGVGIYVGTQSNARVSFTMIVGTTTYIGYTGTVGINNHQFPEAIIRGTFQGEATNTRNPSDKIVITEGRFHVECF